MGLTGTRSNAKNPWGLRGNDVNPKDRRGLTIQELREGETKGPLNVETCVQHLSKPLLGGFGRELSKPTLTRIVDLACKARKSINKFRVFPDPGNKQCEVFDGTIAFKKAIELCQ